MDKMNQALEKMKMLVGMEVDEDDEEQPSASSPDSSSFIDDFNRNCTLSSQQRLYGFAICFVSGIACTLLFGLSIVICFLAVAICRFLWLRCDHKKELGLLSMLVFLHPVKFGVTFTFGNMLALGSTAFLIGPKRQVTMMLDPIRIYATALYLASIIIALFCAVYVHSKILTLFAVILEFGALFWYSLSYIPFARSMVSKIMVSCFDTEF